MDFDEFRQLHLVDELAKVFSNYGKAQLLLRRAEIPIERLPRFDVPLEYWSEVCELLFQGLLPDGMTRLLGAVSQQYPGNVVFRQALLGLSEPIIVPPLPADGQYDAFIAYASRNEAAVESVATALVTRKIEPWFDKWHMPPGTPVVNLWAVLDRVPVVLGFIGPDALTGSPLGRFQTIEVGSVLGRCASDPRFSLIPVLLPGAPTIDDLPGFLRAFGVVRMSSLTDEAALDNLVWGITHRHPRRATR